MKMRMVVGLGGALIIVAVLAWLAVMGVRRHSLPGRAPDVCIPLRVGIQDNVICALPLIADQMGYFRELGLAVELVPYASGKLALQAMFDGEVAAATCADTPIVTASFERDDFAVFATIAWTDRGAWITARRDRGIAAPGDLRGKTVATQRDSAVHFFLSAYLARHGIAEHEVDLRFMPATELPEALAAGTIDAFSMRNPFAAQAKALLGGLAVEFYDPDIYRQTFNLVTWRHALASDAAIWERLLRALAAAEALVSRDSEAARRAVTGRLGGDRSEEMADDWDRYAFTLTLDQSIFVTLEDQARWSRRLDPDGNLRIPNYGRFVETGPLRAVNPAAVKVIR